MRTDVYLNTYGKSVGGFRGRYFLGRKLVLPSITSDPAPRNHFSLSIPVVGGYSKTLVLKVPWDCPGDTSYSTHQFTPTPETKFPKEGGRSGEPEASPTISYITRGFPFVKEVPCRVPLLQGPVDTT